MGEPYWYKIEYLQNVFQVVKYCSVPGQCLASDIKMPATGNKEQSVLCQISG